MTAFNAFGTRNLRHFRKKKKKKLKFESFFLILIRNKHHIRTLSTLKTYGD